MTTTAAPASLRVHRVEVRPTAGDPVADRLVREARAIGVDLRGAASARVYLIEADADEAELGAIEARLLADPVTESAVTGAAPVEPGAALIEVHPLPGVMDPAAQTVERVLRDTFGVRARVSTGWRYDLTGVSAGDAQRVAQRLLANPVVAGVHTEPFHPRELPRGHGAEFRVTTVPIRDLDDAGLERLSREGHLFLDLHEMHAVRAEYRALGREPTDIELETLAQTWSEHCVHKTLKATIRYRSDDPFDPVKRPGRPGHETHADGSVTIHNLLKSTVAAATFELIEEGVDWTLSVFVDNAGIIRFDDETAVCVKVETHNHPSAIEPYGGAATGIGGCIRDIIGTGLAAKPIASTDVFCVAMPEGWTVGSHEATQPRSHDGSVGGDSSSDQRPPWLRGSVALPLPTGCLHPKRVLTEVVAGVRDYGNRMGIPTLNGAVWFDDRYIGNPLVFCGCVGVMPAHLIKGEARPGDRIIALGGRTGRDGIHGATFSSAELTDTHADEFAHAVQIGNAIEEKRVLDAILRARDFVPDGPLFSAITDCGAGGFSSAVGEMGERLGAEVHLDRAPLKYDGLTYTEIWISEAQERMVLAVPEANVPALQRICDEEGVELADLGHFGTDGAELILNYRGEAVGRLPMAFLHEGIPTPTREAEWGGKRDEETKRARDEVGAPQRTPSLRLSVSESLLHLLAHPNIASKHFIIRQYDHEVQGNTVIRPLGGPLQRGPMDGAVIEPVPGTGRGLAIACGLATGFADEPYQMALAAIDECVRNLVAVGADPERTAILDNFCWPSCKKPRNLASLVRAAEGCYDGAKAFRTPFVSGKDSLNNQFTTESGKTIEIPPTLLITGIAIVPDIARCMTMDAKKPGHGLVVVGERTHGELGGSTYAAIFGAGSDAGEHGGALPRVNLETAPAAARFVARAIRAGLVVAVHDVSDGGVACAAAEMLIAAQRRAGGGKPGGGLGAAIRTPALHRDPLAACFGESPTRWVAEIDLERVPELIALRDEHAPHAQVTPIGVLNDSGELAIDGEALPVDDLARAWLGTLDW